MILTYLNILKFIIYIISVISLIYKTVQTQQIQQVNVLFINEAENKPASTAIEVVQNYLKNNTHYGLTLKIFKIEANKTNPKSFLDSICNTYDQSIENQEPPHMVLDTTKWGPTADTVKLFTRSMALPTISVSFGQRGDLKYWKNLSETEQNYLLQIMCPIDIIPHLVRPIVSKSRINDTAILYDETFIMEHKHKKLLRDIKTRYIITTIANGKDALTHQIDRLVKLNINHFFILGTLKSITQVLESLKPKYFGPNFVWFAITIEEDTIKINLNNASIIFIQPVLHPQYQKRFNMLRYHYNLKDQLQIMAVFYFDLALKSFLAVGEMLRSGNWSTDMEYLRCADYENGKTPERLIYLKEYLKPKTVETSYGHFSLLIFRGYIFNSQSLYTFPMNVSLLQIQEGNTINSKPIGSLMADFHPPFVFANEEVKQFYKTNTVYRIFTVVQAPFIIRDDAAPKGYKGYCIDLINEIADIVQFNYTIQEVEDGKFGNMNEKGEWNGVIRKLIDKEADIGLGSISVMAEREMVVDFTVPYYDLVGITIMMHKPIKTRSSSMFNFITVLETNVWLCIMGTYLFTSFLMWLFERLSPYSYRNNRVKYQDNHDQIRMFTFKECLWFCISSLTSQGGGEVPKNISGSLLAAFWWLFGFIIIASYTANLSIFLSVTDIETPVKSLDDLSRQHKIDYAPLNDSMVLSYFQRMANVEQMFHKIWKEMILNDSLTHFQRSKLAVWDYPISYKYNKMLNTIRKSGLPINLEEAMAKVRNSTAASGFAFVGDATDIRYLVMTNCDFQIVGQEFSLKPYAIALQMGSHLKHQFNKAIFELINRRKLKKLKEKWWSYVGEQIKCYEPPKVPDGITLEDVAGIIIVIFGAIAVACIILAFELCWFKFRKNHTS